MSIDFNANEVLEMAEEIERNGAKFYRHAAENTDEPDAKQLLTDLAAWEDGHEKTFASMRADLSTSKVQPTVFDPENEAVQYLRAMADGHVFDLSDPTLKLTGKESLEQILKMALGREEDAIVFFLGMKEMVPANLGKDKIEGIIKEEMGHVVMLSKQIAAIA